MPIATWAEGRVTLSREELMEDGPHLTLEVRPMRRTELVTTEDC